MATSLEDSKQVPMDKIQTNTYHLVKKNRENQSRGSCDNLAQIIVKKEIKQTKYIFHTASLPSGLN